jgi:hypothetical protein
MVFPLTIMFTVLCRILNCSRIGSATAPVAPLQHCPGDQIFSSGNSVLSAAARCQSESLQRSKVR